MRESWRLLDTGLASAARNIALDRALLEARHANESPSTLRFLRFSASALLGCRESPDEELDTAYCSAADVPVQRRVTGGITWFVDERQLGWELYLHRREIGSGGMDMLTKRVGHAAATALSALGIDARFRARDEIEVEGRTVCMLAHAAEGGGVLVNPCFWSTRTWRVQRVSFVIRGRERSRTPAPCGRTSLLAPQQVLRRV